MKFTLRSASGAAILAGLAGTFPAWAQEAPQTVLTPQVSGPQQAAPAAVDQTRPAAGPQAAAPVEKVVVTGSYIQGTAEDAALPVEVYSADELAKQGEPTALEFVKSLSISGPTSGEAYYFGGAGLTGSVNINLRGLGADKTLTLLNGRRMSQNTSNIPSAAIARTEILKDGAAVTYGADATGGVVNFITRDHFTGLEAKAHYKYIDGSDGDYGLSLLGGFGEGDSNFLWSAEWEHRSRLNTTQRDFSSMPYGVNPAPWSTLTNLAGWVPRGTLPATPPRGPAAAGANSANLEWGAPTGGIVSDFTQSSCEAVRGVYSNSYTCLYGYAPYYNLVEDNDIYRLYGQLNTRISDHMDMHVEASFGEVSSPQVFGSPAQPMIRGSAASPGSTYQFYVPYTNPYAAAFAADHGIAIGTGNTEGFTPVTYRTFAHGGNDAFGYGNGFGVPSKIDNQIWRLSAELKGDLGDIFKGPLGETGYSLAGTYNEAISQGDAADIMAYRLQEAVMGFGGPNCHAVDLDPTRFGTQNPAAAGKNGCMWWNPFSSNFASEPQLGLSNPNHVAGSENPQELERWLFDQRLSESRTNSLTVDLVFNGKTPFKLPGGDIGWAAGSQWRQTEYRETVPSNFYNGNTPCQWPASSGQQPLPTSDPNFSGCTPDNPGPFVFFDINPPDSSDQQQLSYFVEFAVPVLDNLNFQLAARHEQFSHNLEATVYKASGKWDVWGPISIRGSYGTNYQAPPAGLIPGRVSNGVNSYSVNNLWLGAQTVTQSSIVPETAKSQDLGIIWASRGFTQGSDFRLIVDYYDIQTKNEIGLLASVNDIAKLIFPTSLGGFADCASPFISRVTFNAGSCIQGVTGKNDFSSMRTDYGNGPGQHTAGYDIQATYSFPLFTGTLTLDATGTRVVLDKNGPKSLDGIQLDAGSNQLGYLNFATIANASSRWRANANVNYNIDKHNFRLVANYVEGVVDQRGCTTPAGRQPGSLTVYGPTCWGVDGTDWLSFDFHYNFDLTDTLRLSASVDNILDKDPPHAREELGYDPRIGNPLGRTFEVGIKKTF
jgi:outer membrane receptor protein involved in Fe transport